MSLRKRCVCHLVTERQTFFIYIVKMTEKCYKLSPQRNIIYLCRFSNHGYSLFVRCARGDQTWRGPCPSWRPRTRGWWCRLATRPPQRRWSRCCSDPRRSDYPGRPAHCSLVADKKRTLRIKGISLGGSACDWTETKILAQAASLHGFHTFKRNSKWRLRFHFHLVLLCCHDIISPFGCVFTFVFFERLHHWKKLAFCQV